MEDTVQLRNPIDTNTLPVISCIETRIVDLPTTRIHKLSNTQIQHQSIVLIRAFLSDGTVGYGEAATLGGPRWSEESVESIKSVIDTYLAPALIGKSAAAFEANARIMGKAAARNNSAKAGVEAAMYDAMGKSIGLSAQQFLGGANRDKIEVLWAMASGDADQEIEEARGKFAAREHRRFKIKIGFATPREDLVRLNRIVEALPECEIVVDVNQGWTEATAKRWIPALEELGVALIEQPLPAGQMAALARITSRSTVPIMIDEGAFSHADIARAGAIHAADVLSLKLVKSGGLMAMREAASIARAHGLELYGGCLLESGLGAAAHLMVLATLPELAWGTEHFGPRILRTDILDSGGIEFRDFALHVPQGPGLGVRIDEALLDDLSRTGWQANG